MNKRIWNSKMVLVLLVTLGLPAVASAQATRTWVSGVGDDANSCSRTAPCKTFAGALNQTAPGGEIDVLTSGGFGAVTINKSVTIDGAANQSGILSSGITAININITAGSDGPKTVRLRNLVLNGAGTGKSGIKITAGRRVFVDGLLIDGFDDHGVLVESFRADVFVSNTIIRNIGKSGIHFAPTEDTKEASLLVERSSIVGTFHALNISRGARATLRDCTLNLHRQAVLAANSEVNLINCVLTENKIAVNSTEKSTVRLTLTSIINNETGLTTNHGGQIISFKNNIVHGNVDDGAPTLALSPG